MVNATASRGVRKNFGHRGLAYVDVAPRAGEGVGALLAVLPPTVDRVVLTGPVPGGDADGFRRWAGDTSAAPGWTAEHDYLTSTGSPMLRYGAPDDSRRVEVIRAASWFGEGDYTPAMARAAMDLLGEQLGRRFAGATLLASPGTTGRDLWLRSIVGQEWPVLDASTQQLIRATSGQARIQLRHVGDELPGLVGYDGRFMYAALCRELGAGVPTLDEVPEYVPFQRGRYFVSWRVPEDWRHVGLLGERKDDAWRWPEEPGDGGSGWVDGCELHIALDHGWPVTIHQRLLFPKKRGQGPLDQWALKLQDVYTDLTATERPVPELAAKGCRAIMLHALGAFVSRDSRVICSCPADQPGRVPVHATAVRLEGDVLRWEELRPAAWPELAHPEWPAAVWARCRSRLLDGPAGVGADGRRHRSGVLHVDASTVVAMRTDAVYLTENPGWNDDGRPGRLRLRFERPGPMPAPRTVGELLRLTKGAK